MMSAAGVSSAQSPASPAGRLADLQRLYQDHRLNDSAYMKAVDSVAPRLLGPNDSTPERLETYRGIAFSDPRWGVYRGHYYTYLALYYYSVNQFGSAIYYSEKNNEERIRTGEFEKGGVAHSDLFAITIYSNQHDYARVLARYDSLRPGLLHFSDSIRSGSVSPNQDAVVFMLMNAVVYAACKAKDSVVAVEAAGLADGMLAAIRETASRYGDRITQYAYLCHLSDFERERFLGHTAEAGALLEQAIGEVKAKGFPPNLQPSYVEFTYTEAFDFYFDRGETDSARLYLDLVKGLNSQGVEYSNLSPEFLAEAGSKLEAREGHYKEAYEALLQQYRIRDSAYYAVSADKTNNLYALTAEENTRAELMRTESGRRRAERSTIYLRSLLALLVLGGCAGFLAYRARQRQRWLNLQLNLARNFHDEIGPMLLFANAAVKKELDQRPSPGLVELKTHLAQIMEAVRDISHDLKSGELSTVESFTRDVTVLLGKIRSAAGIEFQLKSDGRGRILSRWQYTHLTRIMNELIGNSIKHAGCSRITVGIRSLERHLGITYSDDGRGMEPGSFSAGIGLGNIRERTALLRGSFELRNSWPEGYFIELTIPFV